jgi:hypothetical protein
MIKYTVVFQDKDDVWKPVFKDGLLYSRQTAKRKLESLYKAYQGPFELRQVEVKQVCPHCKCEVSTELETIEIPR